MTNLNILKIVLNHRYHNKTNRLNNGPYGATYEGLIKEVHPYLMPPQLTTVPNLLPLVTPHSAF